MPSDFPLADHIYREILKIIDVFLIKYDIILVMVEIHSQAYHADTGKPRLFTLPLQQFKDMKLLEKQLKGITHKIIYSGVYSLSKLFSESKKLTPTNKKILLGNSVCVDKLINLNPDNANDIIDKAITSAQKFTDENVIEKIIKIVETDGNIPYIVTTREEIIAHIIRQFIGKGNGRMQINDLDGKVGTGLKLRDWINEIFSPNPDFFKVGGSAAHLTKLLDSIGEDVTLTTQHNSSELAATFKNDKLKFLSIEDGKIKNKTIVESATPEAPTKINYPIEFKKDIKIIIGKKTYEVKKSDRIAVVSHYYDKDGNNMDTDPILNFTDDQLKMIAQNYDYFFATDPNQLQRIPQDRYSEISKKMVEQFKILRSSGKLKILFEFSGKFEDLKFFRDVLKGNIDSFSINDEEFGKITKNLHEELGLELSKSDDKIIAFYENAFTLAKYLEVERLHIHGQDIDISIRKNATTEKMKREVLALGYGKLRVVQWLLDRKITPDASDNTPLTNALKVEGIYKIIQLSNFLHNNNNDGMIHFLTNGFCKIDDEYSLAALPVKWIYPGGDPIVRTVSAGDTNAGTAVIQSGL